MARGSNALVLNISANDDAFQRAAKAAKMSLADLGRASSDAVADVEREFTKLAANPVDSVKAMTKSMMDELANVRRQAEATLSGQGLGGGGTVGAARSFAAAEALEKLAQAQRNRAVAAQQANAGDERMATMLRAISTNAAAAAIGLEGEAKALRLQAEALALVEAQMDATAESGDDVSDMSGSARSGLQQLAYQANDVAVGLSSGTPVMMVFTQQAGQLVQALSLMSSGASGFLGFLGGPWGLLVTTAATVLGTLAVKSDMFSAATERASSELQENAKNLEAVKSVSDGMGEAQSVMGEMFDLATGKIKQQNDMLRTNILLKAAQFRAEAASDDAQAADASRRSTQSSWGGVFGAMGRAGPNPVLQGLVGYLAATRQMATPAYTNLERVAIGKMSTADAMKWAETADFSGLNITREDYMNALTRQMEAGQKRARADAMEKSIATGKLDPSLIRPDNPRRERQDHSAERAEKLNDAYDAAMAAADADGHRLQRSAVTDPTQAANLDKQAVDAELRQQLAQNARQFLKLDHDALDAKDRQNADLQKMAIDQKLQRELADRDLKAQGDALDFQATMLGYQGDLATTLAERRKIAAELLEIERQQKINALKGQFVSGQINIGQYVDQLGRINQETDAKGAMLQKTQNLSPMDQYRKRLHDATDDMGTALDQVKVDGLQGLEDGLTGLISGTESVASAFKRMAASILADLARIAVEKAILSVIGLKTGDVPGHATGNIPGFASGIISGPGTGTSDSILAMHDRLGLIRVSNGESIITAKGTRKHRNLLRAINDDTLPSFATGMVPAAYPKIPSAQSLHMAGAAPQAITFDLRGAVMTADLLQQMNAISARNATAALAAAPAATMREIAERDAQRIPV